MFCHSLRQGIFPTQGLNLSPALAGLLFTTSTPWKVPDQSSTPSSSIRLPRSPSQDALVSAKGCLVLEKQEHSEGNTPPLFVGITYGQPRKLHWCTCSLGHKGWIMTQLWAS